MNEAETKEFPAPAQGDIEEAAFQNALTAWDEKPARDRRILSPRRHFYHTGYADGSASVDALRESHARLLEAAKAMHVQLKKCEGRSDPALNPAWNAIVAAMEAAERLEKQ